ncbi:hypothetical protein BC827DRAFT_1379066 [Russula dissimulans]|nr:hypothetical protein BC827DRAFT_1379066 [Russula dissimulans]
MSYSPPSSTKNIGSLPQSGSSPTIRCVFSIDTFTAAAIFTQPVSSYPLLSTSSSPPPFRTRGPPSKPPAGGGGKPKPGSGKPRASGLKHEGA